ncbi:zinc finger protein 883-like [Protopterus annectens]|uniref:zinc finger protein 883-like n=1 Tax=Protopterus annectens TaxID=7888 RepID=UPI001CFA5DE0|nr:zinc finger protein 883-like [Protopterus annectens]
MKLEVPETFEDVAVEFSGEEWEMLSKPEKELHKEVMVQNYENMISVGYDIPVDHLWLYIKNFETVSPCDTKGGMMVQQILVPGTRTSIIKRETFPGMQGLQSTHGRHQDSEFDTVLPDKMSVTRQDALQSETRTDNPKESNERFIQTTEQEMHLQTEAGETPCSWLNHSNNVTFCSNNLTDQVSHRRKKQTTLPPNEQVLSGKKLHKYATNVKGFTHQQNGGVSKIIRTGQQPFKCTMYDKSFTLKSNMKKDQFPHSEKRLYKYVTHHKDLIPDHSAVLQTTGNRQKPYKCGKSFTGKASMVKHHNIQSVISQDIKKSKHLEEMKQGQKPYKCATCDKSFKYKVAMLNHQGIHTGQKPYKCSMCDKSFSNKSAMTCHQGTHMEQKPYPCTICGKSFVQRSHLVTHQRIHSGKKPYKCSECDESFSYKRMMVSHQSIHTGEKPYKCSMCDKSFSNKGNMRRHQSTHMEQKPYPCTICGKSFVQKTHLVTHQRIHSGKKPYKCPECDESFRYKRTMISHKSIHTGEKPYKCSMCDKSFSNKITILHHQNIHTGEKPFQCTMCDKSFRYRSSMATHERVHAGQKPYNCTMCDKSFTQRYHMTRHMYIHGGQKPYKCLVCGKSFTQRIQMTRHMCVHGGQKPYNCPVCNKSFTKKSNKSSVF